MDSPIPTHFDGSEGGYRGGYDPVSKGRLGLWGRGVQLWKGRGPKCTFTTPLWGVTIHPSLSGTWHL